MAGWVLQPVVVQFTPSHRSCVINTSPPSTGTGVLVGGSHFWALTGGGGGPTTPEPRPTIGVRASVVVTRTRPDRGRPTPHVTDVPSPFHWFASTLSRPWPLDFQETGTQKVKPDARTWRHNESGDPTPGTEQLCDCRPPPGRHTAATRVRDHLTWFMRPLGCSLALERRAHPRGECRHITLQQTAPSHG